MINRWILGGFLCIERCTNCKSGESQLIFVGNFWSKSFKQMFSLTMDLSFSDWFIWVTVESQMEFFLTSAVNWGGCWDSCGINLLGYAILQTKSCKLYLDFGKDMLLISLTFSGSKKIHFLTVFVYRTLVWSLQNLSCPYYSFKPEIRIPFKTCSVQVSNLFRVDLLRMISSWLFLATYISLIFLQCSVGNLHSHYVSHSVNA